MRFSTLFFAGADRENAVSKLAPEHNSGDTLDDGEFLATLGEQCQNYLLFVAKYGLDTDLGIHMYSKYGVPAQIWTPKYCQIGTPK